jgi:hypothetical protein
VNKPSTGAGGSAAISLADAVLAESRSLPPLLHYPGDV